MHHNNWITVGIVCIQSKANWLPNFSLVLKLIKLSHAITQVKYDILQNSGLLTAILYTRHPQTILFPAMVDLTKISVVKPASYK